PSERLIEAIRSAHTGGAPNPKFVVELGERVLRVAAVPMRSWIDEGEDETLLMLEDLGGIERLRTAAPASRAVPADLPAIVWQADAATLKFTSVTGDAERLLGYQVSHWLTAPRFFSERIHPDDRVSTMACYQGAIARGGDAGAEYRALSASGDVVWCRETIRVSGRTITGVITDIGRRKQLEEVILALVSAARAREQSRVTVACDVETIAESVASATLRPGVYARILIHGDGPGPEPEKRAALFESFLTAKDPEKGAGPALAR